MSSVRVWNGSSWDLVPDGSAFRYWDGAAWTSAKTVRYWNGSSWVTVWNRSNPITLHFYPRATTAIRTNGFTPQYDPAGTAGNDTQADLFSGGYDGAQPYRYLGVMEFGASSVEGPTLGQAVAERPVIKSATLRLTRGASGGWATMYAGAYVSVGLFKKQNMHLLPSLTNGELNSLSDFSPTNTLNLDGVPYGATVLTGVYTSIIQEMLSNNWSLAITDDAAASYTSDINMGSGNWTTGYSKWYGLANGSNAQKPYLTVTLDYV